MTTRPGNSLRKPSPLERDEIGREDAREEANSCRADRDKDVANDVGREGRRLHDDREAHQVRDERHDKHPGSRDCGGGRASSSAGERTIHESILIPPRTDVGELGEDCERF